MSQAEDEAVAVGFELGKVLRRYDRWRAAVDAWSADSDDDAKHDEALLAEDALLLSVYRVVRYFAFDGQRATSELSPGGLVPGWQPQPKAMRSLRQHLDRLGETFFLTGLAPTEPLHALMLRDLVEVANAFSWAVRAEDPDAARQLDHNLVELRKRLRS